MNSSIKFILDNATTIAILGASRNQSKDSYKVMQYLQHQGYKTIPINPKACNETILGEKVYEKITDIESNIDILDIFRPKSEILDICKEATNNDIKTIWLQLDIYCEKSAKLLEKTNINFVQDKCIKIEHEKFKKQNLT